MKKQLIGALAFAVSGATAHAQSSVTLYGIIDLGIAHISNLSGQSATKMLDAVSVPTRWGITGEEDIGAGTKVIFKLENGFFASNGQQNNPNSFFNRQSYVGVSNDQYGVLTVGHQSSLEFDMVAPLYAACWALTTDLNCHPGNFDDLYNSHQTDSSFKYRSPSFRGFEFGLLYGGLTGTAGNPAYARAYQAVGTYKIGNFAASTFYGSENNRSLGIQAATGVTSLFGVKLTSVPFVADNVKNIAAGARYALGPGTYSVLFTQTRIQYRGQSANMNNYDVAAKWLLTPSNLLGLGVTQTHFDGGVWNTGGITYNYLLSKQSAVYVQEFFQRASSGHVAAITTVGLSSSRSQNLVMVGMRHSF